MKWIKECEMWVDEEALHDIHISAEKKHTLKMFDLIGWQYWARWLNSFEFKESLLRKKICVCIQILLIEFEFVIWI